MILICDKCGERTRASRVSARKYFVTGGWIEEERFYEISPEQQIKHFCPECAKTKENRDERKQCT